MALVRGLIRRDKRDLTSGARPRQHRAGHADRRRLRRRDRLRVHQLRAFRAGAEFPPRGARPAASRSRMDGPAIAGGLRAAACDLPYGLIPDIGTDLPRVNPQTYQPVQDAARRAHDAEVPAIHLDVVLLHAPAGR